MPRRLLALIVGVPLLALLPVTVATAAPANVKLRIEGSATTLLPRTALRTDNHTVNKDGVAGHDCTGTSVAGALDVGLGGDWSGTWFAGLKYSVERIRSESHVFPEPDYFELRVNNSSLSVGVCGAELQEGDDVLLFVQRCEVGPAPDYACQNQPVLPLGLVAPTRVAPGVPFSVSVVEYAADGRSSPVQGATVSGGDQAVLTGATGVATVTVAAGARTLQATKAGRARSAAEPVCATTGSDGLCGTTAPAAQQQPPPGPQQPAPPPCESSGDDGRCGSRDRRAPAANIRGIADGQRFTRVRGPRTIEVRVDPDPSGLFAVKLRLTRTHRGRCTTYSGGSERLVRVGCGAQKGLWFGVGDRQETSYLLPRRLPVGRYVLDVNAIDGAFNRDDARRRGGNRVVFHVR